MRIEGTSIFAADAAPIVIHDAVAAIVLTPDGRYLLQERDDIPGIWYPGHLGCFGGGIDPGEDVDSALAREMTEEIGLAPRDVTFFMRMDFDLRTICRRPYFRSYFQIRLTTDEEQALRLGEGRAMKRLTDREMLDAPNLIPYDGFALFLHARGSRVAEAA
jgi:8-oxo-dGTP pyrophosphatase MutT (NUDIX family)